MCLNVCPEKVDATSRLRWVSPGTSAEQRARVLGIEVRSPTSLKTAEAQAEFRKSAEWLRSLPDRLRPIENFDLNIEALQDANVAGAAVSAVDAETWSP